MPTSSCDREIVSSTRQDGCNNRTTLIRRMYRNHHTRPVSSSSATHDSSLSRPVPRRLTTVIMLSTARDRGVTVQDLDETTENSGTTHNSQHQKVHTTDISLCVICMYQNHLLSYLYIFAYRVRFCCFHLRAFANDIVIPVFVVMLSCRGGSNISEWGLTMCSNLWQLGPRE